MSKVALRAKQKRKKVLKLAQKRVTINIYTFARVSNKFCGVTKMRRVVSARRDIGEKMIKIAIVEDEISEAEKLKEAIKKFGASKGVEFEIYLFPSALIFLNDFHKGFDLIFLDILMPNMNGLELARTLRKTDGRVQIIFVTNLANCAVNGYEVDALDFIVKPFNTEHLKKTLEKFLGIYNNLRNDFVALKNRNVVKVVALSDILYIDIVSHCITYHFGDNETFCVWGNLEDELKRLNSKSFVRINAYSVINLKKITGIDGNYVRVGDAQLQITRTYKKKVEQQMTDFYIGTI